MSGAVTDVWPVDILRKSEVLRREEERAMYGRQQPRDIITESFRVTVEDEVLEEERRKDADKRARRLVARQ